MVKLFEYIKGDRIIWMIVMLLSIFSLLAVYSSTGTLAYKFKAGNTEYFLIKHLIILAFGLGLMFVAHKVKYTYYSRISQLAIIIAVPLLLATLLMGTSVNDANRWLTLPVINLSFQSSDFAKLALIMYLARILTKKQDQIKDFKSAFIPIMLPVIVICGLILPSNFSTAAILFVTSIVIMFIGRINIKYILAIALVGGLALSIFLLILMQSSDQGRLHTWKNRVENFVNPSEADNYQTDQAKIAIATGGVLGKLPGNSTQRNFLPQAFSDFIYAIIVEEYGLWGSFLILLFYMIFMYRGVRIAHKAPGTYGSLLVAGLTFSLVFQAMINMAVAVNLLPVTGQPLPLVSMGGTSLWFTSIAIGIILSVSRKIEENNIEETGGEYATT